MTIAVVGLKVIGQGQTSKVKVKGQNAVGGISIFNRGQFLVRDVIYTSRAYAMMSVFVCLSVCL